MLRMQDDNLKENQEDGKPRHGGYRPGSGRPKHSKNPVTIEKEEALRQFKDRVAKNVTKLFNSQMDLATGEKFLMVTRRIGQGAKSRSETEVITDPETIKQFIDEELDNTDTEYYFMTTRPANNQALEGMLNRAFGRATESVEVDAKVYHKWEEMDDDQLERAIQERKNRAA